MRLHSPRMQEIAFQGKKIKTNSREACRTNLAGFGPSGPDHLYPKKKMLSMALYYYYYYYL